MKRKIAFAIISILIASILFDIIIKELVGFIPWWLTLIKFMILLGANILCIFAKSLRTFLKYTAILTVIILSTIFTDFISATPLWKSAFDTNSFVGNFGSVILLKFIGIIPVIFLLLFMFKPTKEFYLSKGDLSIKAEKISWLGISKDSISWSKLSIISAVLISFGTILLTVFTVTDISAFKGIDKLIRYLPLIVLFALCNSFCEGFIFRNAILGTLKMALPKKYVILIAAIFFGIAHYYGAPSGVVGVAMSGILGWYMCRSMYETKGFVSSWIIHFMQDIVIFSTICILGNFI